MITLKLNKVRNFTIGEVVHLKVVNIIYMAPGKWQLTADDVTPLPGAETGYACHNCGIMEASKPDGSLPDGWTKKEYEEGSCFACPECQDVQMCRVCGCTEEHACEGGCYWVESDLCSACEGEG